MDDLCADFEQILPIDEFTVLSESHKMKEKDITPSDLYNTEWRYRRYIMRINDWSDRKGTDYSYIKQKINEYILEKDNIKAGDPVGFCVAWCIWYVNLRLSNPDIDRKDVLEQGIKIIDTKFNSFRNFIRSYSKFLSEYSKKLKETEDVSYTFREMRGMFDLF